MNIFIGVSFIFIVLRFAISIFNFISDPKLTTVSIAYDDLVSILIPVRNEEKNIITLLHSITAQDYKNYEVIIIDDDSSDQTYAVCKEFADAHPLFSIVKGKQLPEGWLGKNFACHQLAQHANGKFLLFLDADEKIFDHLINSGIYRMYKKKLSLLSLFTNQEMPTMGEKLVVPLMNFILLNLLPLRSIIWSQNKAVAAASGQFMLFDAELYRQNQWHSKVRNKVVEDVEIMRLIKSFSLKGETLLANGMISCRMYVDYNTAINGFSKNFLAGFNYSITGFLCYMLLLILGPILIIMNLNVYMVSLTLFLIGCSRIMISLLSGQNPWYNTLLHPLQMLNLVVIGCLSIQKYITKKTVWKGRRV